MNNSKKMMEAIKETGLHFKSTMKKADEVKSCEEIFKKTAKDSVKKFIKDLGVINNLITKMDCIFLESTIGDNLDLNSLLYYQNMRCKLMNGVDNILKTKKFTIKGLNIADFADIQEEMFGSMDDCVDQLKKHSNG